MVSEEIRYLAFSIGIRGHHRAVGAGVDGDLSIYLSIYSNFAQFTSGTHTAMIHHGDL